MCKKSKKSKNKYGSNQEKTKITTKIPIKRRTHDTG